MSNTLAVINQIFQDSQGRPLAGLIIALLTGTVNGASPVTSSTQPGSPLATCYADPQGTTELTNPNPGGFPLPDAYLTTDGYGNLCSVVNGVETIGVWVAASAYYVLQAYGAGIVGQQLIPFAT
jgi:hypothetical protein